MLLAVSTRSSSRPCPFSTVRAVAKSRAGAAWLGVIGGGGDSPAQRLAIDGENDTGAGRRLVRHPWRLEEGAERLLHLTGVDRRAQDAAPGTLVGQGGAREAKQLGEVGGAELGPMGDGLSAPLPRELGEHGTGQQDGQGRAPTAPRAAVGDGL